MIKIEIKLLKGTIVYNKPRKDFRFKLLLNTNNNFKIMILIFNILYTRYKNNSSHFDALLKKK